MAKYKVATDYYESRIYYWLYLLGFVQLSTMLPLDVWCDVM